jgi:hypothetical protein
MAKDKLDAAAAAETQTDKKPEAGAETSADKRDEATGDPAADPGRDVEGAAEVARDPLPHELRRNAFHHSLVRIRGNVASASRRLDVHALAAAVIELIDLIEHE